MKGNHFAFESAHFLYYECPKINLNCGWSCKDRPDLIKNKQAIINAIIKKDDKCFEHTVIVAINCEKMEKKF